MGTDVPEPPVRQGAGDRLDLGLGVFHDERAAGAQDPRGSVHRGARERHARLVPSVERCGRIVVAYLGVLRDLTVGNVRRIGHDHAELPRGLDRDVAEIGLE